MCPEASCAKGPTIPLCQQSICPWMPGLPVGNLTPWPPHALRKPELHGEARAGTPATSRAEPESSQSKQQSCEHRRLQTMAAPGCLPHPAIFVVSARPPNIRDTLSFCPLLNSGATNMAL